MNVTVRLFWILAAFFYVVAAGYTIWALVDEYTGYVEWIGSAALLLAGMMATLIAFYVARTYKAQGGELPEDRPEANIEDGDAEQGFFSPWSWWPISLAAGAALVFLGIAAGVWIALIGAPIVLISVVGWTYEYYRGNFGR
jgi:hypothetical protein